MNSITYLDSIDEFILINGQRVGGYRDNHRLYNIYEKETRDKNHINSSTIFVVSSIDSEIILRRLDVDKKMIPADQSFEAPDQQVSIAKGENCYFK